jgi:hypothetical protein
MYSSMSELQNAIASGEFKPGAYGSTAASTTPSVGSAPPSSALTAMLAKAREAYTAAQNTNPMDMSKLFPRLSNPYAQMQPSSVTDLYTNILGRTPDTEGLNYWTQQFGEQISPQETQKFLAGIRDYTTANGIDGYREQYGNQAANRLSALQNTGYTTPQFLGSSGAGRFAGGLLSPST